MLSHVLESLKSMRTFNETWMDAENFYRLVLIVKSIAIARPQNLAKFAEHNTTKYTDTENKIPLFESDRIAFYNEHSENNTDKHLVLQLMDVLWTLHMAYPKNLALAPVVVSGLTHTEATTYAIVEIIHAFTICDVEWNSGIAAKLYLQLLLSSDTAISFSAKKAIIKVLRPRFKRRRVYIPSPTHCSTPGTTVEIDEKPIIITAHASHTSQENREQSEPQFDVDTVEPMLLLGAEQIQGAAGIPPPLMNPLDALLEPGAFPQLLDLPSDTDDEAMVELAIALSLQDHEGGPDLHALQQSFQGLVNLQGIRGLPNLSEPTLQTIQALATQAVASGQEAGSSSHYSDTTTSAGGSDDEGSTAATDGSTLRTSPAEQGGSGGSKGSESGSSESGGSVIDSITGEHNISRRSSAYGDNNADSAPQTSGASGSGCGTGQPARSETSTLSIPTTLTINEQAEMPEQEPSVEQDNEITGETISKLHAIRLSLLENFTQFIPEMINVSGVLSIPFMQVLLMLTSDLDGQDERDRNSVERLLNVLVNELNMDSPDINDINIRTNKREVHLVIMRLLSVLMSRSKYNIKTQSENANFVSQMTAGILSKAGVIDYCLTLLKALLEYWKKTTVEDSSAIIGGQLLKEHLTSSPPDMSPFFLRQYVKGHATDVFEPYPQLLTEMALRLPYQVHKYAEGSSVQSIQLSFDQQAWYYYLCEYMMLYQTPFIRRQVRKLLQFICGNKDKYRQLRDLHALVSHMQSVQQSCNSGGYDSLLPLPLSINLPYDSLVELMEHLKCCVEVATSRTGNWQRFCLKHNTVLSYLFTVSTLLDEGVSPTVLQLLQCAICSNTKPKESKLKEFKAAMNAKERRDRAKSEDSDIEAKFEETQCVILVEQIQKQVSSALLTKFIKTFLLETNNTNVRWQAHSLILAIYKNSGTSDQEALLDLLWHLWPLLPVYGRKAAQFVDLLGYFSLKTPDTGKKDAQLYGTSCCCTSCTKSIACTSS